MISREIVCRACRACRVVGQHQWLVPVRPWLGRPFSTNITPPEGTPTVKRVWKLLFGRYLLVTNTVSSGVLMLFGDIAAQEIERRRHSTTHSSSYDWQRVFNMALVGLSQGPLHHFLYKWMDALLPGASIRTVFKKIGIDQFVISPIFIVTYLYSAGILEGASVADCTRELRHKYWTIYVADWLVWPPTQFINFYLIGPKYRVLYINAITMLYNVFLCYIKHNDDMLPTLLTGSETSKPPTS